MKKKGQTLSLVKFTAVAVKPDYQDPIVLPTVLHQRTAEELDRDGNRLGGEFSNYGSDSPNKSSGGGDNSSNSRWVPLGFLMSRGETLGLGIRITREGKLEDRGRRVRTISAPFTVAREESVLPLLCKFHSYFLLCSSSPCPVETEL
ncbi:hypothetical protein PIB30_054733 [Stylosanthes scabra]|uniref:Uncharacterized protein n=1 Tax=Stylosanthes scabra TaxID=79078 RepID=A0ABU6SIT5_9FABA|nr:hypothetical protein [Stylosanthes scabra]